MEDNLKKLLKTIRLNESTISMFLGLAVVVIVGGMVVNYFRETPTELPTVEDALIADNQTLNTVDDNTLNNASASAAPTQDQTDTLAQANTEQVPTLQPTATPIPTNTPAPTSTPIPTEAPQPTATTAPQPTATPELAQTEGQIASGVNTTNNTQVADNSSYTVQAGDDLWNIAEQQYGTGYAWVEIAKANDITNPNIIEKGTQLSLPELEKAYPTTLASAGPATGGPVTQPDDTTVSNPTPNTTNEITADTYTVAKGDTLWSIAERAYNDGFQWNKIAQANNLSNPRIIEVGNTLSIPRN